ncbi:hypothetical protein M0657_007273 [Pyricularia oryzae]|nr:hypothetical protein M0657_007273 [Pyricularia oryzae]KAI7924955.1 hypothetical protein M9X92_003531 [Pyricularia oryzae]
MSDRPGSHQPHSFRFLHGVGRHHEKFHRVLQCHGLGLEMRNANCHDRNMI